MEVFSKDKNFAFVLSRKSDDLSRVQNSPLEAELMNYLRVPRNRKAIMVYEKERQKIELKEDSNPVKLIINHQVITSLIHGGVYKARYDGENMIYVTDGIPHDRFI